MTRDSGILARMRLAFTKMHGLGNDFIVFEADRPGRRARGGRVAPTRAIAARASASTRPWCSSRRERAGTDVYYRVFNADGSEVEQCGNGARCIARLVASRRRRTGDRPLVMDSPGGLVDALLRPDGLVSVAMGVPDFDPASLPFMAPRRGTLLSPRHRGRAGRVRRGVDRQPARRHPRAQRRATLPWTPWDPRWRITRDFPRRVNVGFLEIVAPDHVRLRVFERGAGETLACGTGACAAVAVGRRHGPLAEEVNVDVPGGRMIVRWAGPGEQIWLTGPAETAFEGHVDIDGAGSPESAT